MTMLEKPPSCCPPLDICTMTKRPTTRQLVAKVPNVPCLHRHRINGTYYGTKRLKGKEKDHSLDSTDRKVAKRKPKEFLSTLVSPKVEAAPSAPADVISHRRAIPSLIAAKSPDEPPFPAHGEACRAAFAAHGSSLEVKGRITSLTGEFRKQRESYCRWTPQNRAIQTHGARP
jgi:hypothetical protein